MAVNEQDVTSSPFAVGNIVQVRCVVNSVTGGPGSGGRVNLTVETPGLVGEAAGVTLSVSPSQCRRSTTNSMLGATNPAV